MSSVKKTRMEEQRTVGILVEFNFEDAELIYPYYRMKEAGFKTLLIGPAAAQQYKGKHGYPVKSDVSIDNVTAEQLTALIIPGGWAPDYWRRDQRFLKLVRDMDEQRKLIATICHAAWMLISAKVIRGRKLTAFVAIKDDVENAGGVFLDQEVVVCGNLVTSRTPNDLPDFLKAILEFLGNAS